MSDAVVIGKTVDYKNPDTGEVREFIIPFGEEIPKTQEKDGSTWYRLWGCPVHIPIHMQAKEDHWRANTDKFSGSPTGKRTVF